MFESVELRDVRVFLAVAEELHFGRAAQRVGLTSSRVSQTVRLLETRVGGRLFERTSRRVRLTPLGEQFLQDVGPAYEQLQGAFEQVRSASDRVAGTVRLGTYSPGAAGPHMREIISTFEERYPECSVEYTDIGWKMKEEDLLRTGEIDLVTLRLPRHEPDLAIGPLLTSESRAVLVSKDDPLASRESVTLQDLTDRALTDITWMNREMIDEFIPPRAPDGTVFRRLTVNSMLECLMLVADGRLVHPTVATFPYYHPHPGVVSVPLEGLPRSYTALVWLKATRSPNVLAFARTASDILATHHLGGEVDGSEGSTQKPARDPYRWRHEIRWKDPKPELFA